MWKLMVILVATGTHCVPRTFDPEIVQIGDSEQHQSSCGHYTEKLQLRLHIKANVTYHLPRTMEARTNVYRNTPGIGYHKLHVRPLSWNHARKACEAEGGHLAVINSEAEAQVLKKLINSDEVSGQPVYLGIHDFFEEGDWITVFGQPLSLAGWTKWTTVWPHQPDNAHGGQNCGALRDDGGIDDVTCSMLYPFICELR